MFQILVVEDDRHTAHLMKEVLNAAGYEVFQAGDGLEALEVMDHQHVDLILLDIMMPNMDGYEFVETVRESGDMIPVLMLTAKELRQDKIRGFKSGVDDYMVKPADEEEMLLRIGALLRRSRIAADHILTVGEVSLNYDASTVTWRDRTETIPNKEFLLLFKLLSYPNRTFTRLQLMDEIWGMDSETDDRTLNVHVNRLRKRFSGCEDFEIRAVRGVGYKAVICAGEGGS